jgi:hypothetical protein
LAPLVVEGLVLNIDVLRNGPANVLSDADVFASWKAMVVKNLPAWLTSPPPLEKKKLAPRQSYSNYLRAMVRAIVDFPVPAKPLSQ